ncbi:hypothetical protein DFH27DRAFT_536117 [Peziza echinospora]|nr:hypothetical protein DFH27DRAFT_536117 [Peziza echinospora]
MQIHDCESDMDTIKVEKSKMERSSSSSGSRKKGPRFHGPLSSHSGRMSGTQDSDTLTPSEPCIETAVKIKKHSGIKPSTLEMVSNGIWSLLHAQLGTHLGNTSAQIEFTGVDERTRLDEKHQRHNQHHRRPMRHRIGHPLPEIIALPKERCAFNQLELTTPPLDLTSSHAMSASEHKVEHPVSLCQDNIFPFDVDDMAAEQLDMTTEQPKIPYVYHTKSTQTDEPQSAGIADQDSMCSTTVLSKILALCSQMENQFKVADQRSVARMINSRAKHGHGFLCPLAGLTDPQSPSFPNTLHEFWSMGSEEIRLLPNRNLARY